MLRRCVKWNDLVAIAATTDDDATYDEVTHIMMGIIMMRKNKQ